MQETLPFRALFSPRSRTGIQSVTASTSESAFRTGSNAKHSAGAASPSDTKKGGPATSHAHPRVARRIFWFELPRTNSLSFCSATPDRPAGQPPPCGARRRTNAGKRTQRFDASTSGHAFWLWRVSCGVWCRGTDVASSWQIVDAGSSGYERARFPGVRSRRRMAGRTGRQRKKAGPKGPALRYAQPDVVPQLLHL